jgi:hypothetical protein
MKAASRILCSLLFAVMSTAVLAQGNGGNGNGGSGGGNAHGAATAGMTSGGDPASGAMGKPHTYHSKMTNKSSAGMTNMPGADASSDTKGR